MERSMRNMLVALVLSLLAIVVLMVLVYYAEDKHHVDRRQQPSVAIGGSFTLTNHRGEPTTNADLRGKLKLIYFGFSYCPDICPTDLYDITLALNRLSPNQAAKVQPVFITIDPERDTPEVLADYLTLFHPSFLGLTGTPEQIADVAAKFRVYYAKVPHDDTYLLNHSAFTYLFDAEGNFLHFFRHSDDAEAILAVLKSHL
jgi:protein SCO1/2